uniref:Fanconi anemia group G protein homolog isoform X1 n=1 Tax=Petromyzon marinus TaxID=7757 RepID=A0AAJ7X6X5_PETMA|nr:Fanconi anemia group G protein homolog isoform X1 [Petromyzon marinus]
MAAAAMRRRRLDAWVADNQSGVRRARMALTASPPPGGHIDLGPHCSTFTHALQQIRGLPATSATLPVELDVCFNAVCLSSCAAPFSTEADEVIRQTLSRVLQVSCTRVEAPFEVDAWSAAMNWAADREAARGLGQLLTLQAFLWLLRKEVERATSLLSLTKKAESMEGVSDSNNVSMESPVACVPSGPLQYQSSGVSHTVLDPESIIQALSTWEALMKGNALCVEEKWLDALDILEGVSQRCTSRRFLALAQNLMARCFHSLGKVNLAMVLYRRCVETDARHLSAIYGLSLLFRRLGRASAELQALVLLSSATGLQAAEKEAEDMGGDSVYLLGQGPEALLCQSVVHVAEHLEPTGALYLLASRSRQLLRLEEAVERYEELLALLSDSAAVQVEDVGLTVPRIPALYLELASTFLHLRKHDRVIAICDDVISKTSCTIPQKLVLDMRRGSAEMVLHVAHLNPPREAEDPVLSAFFRDSPGGENSSYPQTVTWDIGNSSVCSFADSKQDLADVRSRGRLSGRWAEFGWLWGDERTTTLPAGGGARFSMGSHRVRESLHAALWTVSARVLRAAALLGLGKADEALREFDRSTDELFKVTVIPSPLNKDCSVRRELPLEELALNLLKSLVFDGIAGCLETMGRDTDALQYYLCSLQANPGGVHSMYGLVQLLSKLNRKGEAVAHWLSFRGLLDGDRQINPKGQSLTAIPDLGPYNYVPEQAKVPSEGELLELDRDFLLRWDGYSSEERKILRTLATGLSPLSN